MNKTLAITTIALVAVVMGMSAVTSAMASPDETPSEQKCRKLTEALEKAVSEGKLSEIRAKAILLKAGCVEAPPPK